MPRGGFCLTVLGGVTIILGEDEELLGAENDTRLGVGVLESLMAVDGTASRLGEWLFMASR